MTKCYRIQDEKSNLGFPARLKKRVSGLDDNSVLNYVLTVDVVDVVNSHLLVINFLPPERQFISNTVGKCQRFGDPEMI